MSRFRTLYNETIKPSLIKDFELENPMKAPKLEKIVLNIGVGEGAKESKKVEAALQDLMTISGQKPVLTKARKSIAGFKIREGMNLGVKVTLRGERMYEFLDRLITIAMPRIRDFRGVSPRSFDGQGNYSMGLKEQIVFPEIDYDKVDQIRGMDITIVTTSKDNQQAKALLAAFGMPFSK